MKKLCFLFSFILFLSAHATTQDQMNENAIDLINAVDYKVLISKDGQYTINIKNLYFSKSNSLLNIFNNYFWNKEQLKASFRQTGVELKEMKLVSNSAPITSCVENQYTIQNISSKKFKLGFIEKKFESDLHSQCTLRPTVTSSKSVACEQTCTLINNTTDAKKYFNFTSAGYEPKSITTCHNTLDSTVCSIEIRGSAKGAGLNSAAQNALSGSIVSLKSTINLMLQSHGHSELNLRAGNEYNSKIDYWQELKRNIENSKNKIFKATSMSRSDSYSLE